MDNPHAQQVCDLCKAHHGRDLQRVIALHRLWWHQYTTQAVANHRDRVRGLRSQVEQLSSDLADREWKLTELTDVVERDYESAPLGPLQSWLSTEIVKAAEARTATAYRSRDRHMATLWRLDNRHRDGKQAGTCACGQPAAKCRDRELLDASRDDLYRWENRELERLKDGKRHGLPDEHPEVRKRSRSWSSVYGV
jgi:hypothetical protein